MAGGLGNVRGPVCAALVLLSAGRLPCLCDEDGLPSGADVVVAKLMETRWHQRRPFNDFMPVDWPDMPASGNAVRSESKRGRMPCGCVADAMGQILRHYEWPVRLDETAIPGLTYTLLRSNDLSTVRLGTAVDTQIAEGLRVRLQDKKSANNRVFYVIRVTTGD